MSSIGSRGRWAECLTDLEVPLMSRAVSLTDPTVCQIDPELPDSSGDCPLTDPVISLTDPEIPQGSPEAPQNSGKWPRGCPRESGFPADPCIYTSIFCAVCKFYRDCGRNFLKGYRPRKKIKMGNYDFIPGADLELDAWLNNFVQKCELYEGELGLDSTTFGQISAAATNFSTKLDDVNTTKETLRGQVTTKDDARKTTVATVRAFAKQFKAIPGIDPGILSALNILSTGTTGPVTVVTDLTVNGCNDGVNTLKWNRNGNAQGTQFIIESSPNGSTLWDLVDVVTRADYKHTGQIPGEKQYYRIRSKRAGITSPPSPAVVVYSNGAGPGLQIAA